MIMHISGSVIAPKRKTPVLDQAQPGDPPLFGESPSWAKKRKGGKKSHGKKKVPASPAKSTNFETILRKSALVRKKL